MNKEIRPINYLGSKLRILEEIENVIDELDPNRNPVCDLFAGSGTVSNYLSSKRRIVAIDIQEYSRVLCSALLNKSEDLMDGDKIVKECVKSNAYKEIKDVFSALIEYENKCINNAVETGNNEKLCEFLEHSSLVAYQENKSDFEELEIAKIFSNTVNAICKCGYLNKKKAIIARYYGGVYFSYNQAIEMDILLQWIEKQIDLIVKDKYLAAILSSASDIVNTVGKQFAQPINCRDSQGKPKKDIGIRIKKDRELSFFDYFKKWLKIYAILGDKNNSVYRMDYLDGINELGDEVKVVYADPPYTRYHYSRYYHVLETICLYDNPKISKVKVNGEEKVSKGIYREGRHQSPFCIKSQAYDAFKKLIISVSKKKINLILSYSPYDKESNSTPRLMTISQIVELASKYYENIEVREVGGIVHSKLNSRDKNFEIKCGAEVLIICR